MWKWIKRIFVVGSLVIDTIQFIQLAIEKAQSSMVTQEGRVLIDKWRELFPNHVRKGEAIKVKDYEPSR